MTVVVQPGDTLIVCCSDRLTVEQAAELRRQLLDRLAGVGDVVIVPANQVAAYRTPVRDD